MERVLPIKNKCKKAGVEICTTVIEVILEKCCYWYLNINFHSVDLIHSVKVILSEGTKE